jgi:hypothetical protein
MNGVLSAHAHLHERSRARRIPRGLLSEKRGGWVYRYRLLLFALVALIAFNSCQQPAPQASTQLVPVLCHRELGVGLLFITVVNRGSEAASSMMTVAYQTGSHRVPSVRLTVKTPIIPGGSEVWLAVELPLLPGTAVFLRPISKVTIVITSAGSPSGNPGARNARVSDCNDKA